MTAAIPKKPRRTDFTAVAKILHWLMAALILGQLCLGMVMTENTFNILDGHQKSVAVQWHKSIGMTILVLALVRLAWRFMNMPPAFPAYIPRWERKVATITELLIYVLMIAMPLVGWMIISTLPHPSTFFGLFPIPNLPGLSDLPAKKEIREVFAGAHAVLAMAIVGLMMMHIGAALKHHFIDRDGILFRMTPRFLGRFLRIIRFEFKG